MDWAVRDGATKELSCPRCLEKLGMRIPVSTADDFNVIKADHLLRTHVCPTPRQLRDAANRAWER